MSDWLIVQSALLRSRWLKRGRPLFNINYDIFSLIPFDHLPSEWKHNKLFSVWIQAKEINDLNRDNPHYYKTSPSLLPLRPTQKSSVNTPLLRWWPKTTLIQNKGILFLRLRRSIHLISCPRASSYKISWSFRSQDRPNITFEECSRLSWHNQPKENEINFLQWIISRRQTSAPYQTLCTVGPRSVHIYIYGYIRTIRVQGVSQKEASICPSFVPGYVQVLCPNMSKFCDRRLCDAKGTRVQLVLHTSTSSSINLQYSIKSIP